MCRERLSLIVRKDSFNPKAEKNEDAYFEELRSASQKHQLQDHIKENYDDYLVPYCILDGC
jgi:hypothetical protein